MKKYFIKYSIERHYNGTFGPYKMMEDKTMSIEAKNLFECIKKFNEEMDSRISVIYRNQKGRNGIIQEIICGNKIVYRASEGQLNYLESIRDQENFIRL